MKHDRKFYWEDHKTLFGEHLEIPKDLDFLDFQSFQGFIDGWVAKQIKEAKKIGIRKASEGYEV